MFRSIEFHFDLGPVFFFRIYVNKMDVIFQKILYLRYECLNIFSI